MKGTTGKTRVIQLSLFHVAEAYAQTQGKGVANGEIYRSVANAAGLCVDDLNTRQPIGEANALRSPVRRKIRWYQQTLKHLGVIEHVPGQRGVWRLAHDAGQGLHKIIEGAKLVAFSTRLGVAIWANNASVFSSFRDPIALCITSPPYPLRVKRAYGGPSVEEYPDFICTALEGIVRALQPGGSIVLNVSNDVFETRSPARSLYIERLVLALHDRLGLALMDRVPWVNFSKPPGPTWWACRNRVQLSAAYEHQLWFTNDPLKVRSDNRRTLEEHTARHRQLMINGGAQRTAVYGDGAYRIRENSYSRETPGKLARNVMVRGHACGDTQAYRRAATALGIAIHGAMMPTALPDFWIRFLTERNDLVVDPFAGTARTGLAAERLGRRWLVTEWMLEYLKGASSMFSACEGYSSNATFL